VTAHHPPGDVVLPHIEGGFEAAPILVFGDVMLDRHVGGAVGRISPEAPVPVVHVDTERETPGGAGNVALNLAGLGCRPRLVGVVGDDAARDALLRSCERTGVDTAALVVDPARPTITKTRVIGGHQQMLRLDGARAVVVSDYAKGVVQPALCRRVIAAARERGLPVLGDPKGRDWAHYAGATALSPNRAELAGWAGTPLADLDAELGEARRLLAELELTFVALTRSESGMARVGRDDHLVVPALAREVFDVSGAGDTAIATLAAALAVGLDHDDALRLANVAAGVVVARVGTVAIDREALLVEVLAEVERRGDSKV